MSALRLKLADGTEIEGTIEGAISGQLRDLLATGYAGNKMRIAADESDDVEGHALATSVRLKLFDEDDVEGHALSLRLPNAEAARELQQKLLATGVAGLIVVGAVTTAVVAPDLLKGTDAPAAPVAPAPITQTIPGDESAASRYQVGTGYGQSAVPDAAQGIYPAGGTAGYGQSQVPPAALGEYPGSTTAETPGISPAVRAEMAAGDADSAGYGQSQVPPAALGEYPAGTTAETPGVSPAVRAEMAAGDADSTGYGQSQVPPAAQGIYPEGTTPDDAADPAEDFVGRPGEPRAQ